MAQQEQTVFQSFDNGLDAFTNPHRLNPTAVGVAIGLAQDRPGYVYPGPGYAATAWTQTFTVLHSIFSYSLLASGQIDCPVYWGIQTGNTPLLVSWLQPVNLTIQTATPPIYPFQQTLAQLKHGDITGTSSTDGIVTSPPQIAVTGSYRVAVWTDGGGFRVVFTHHQTGVSSGIMTLADVAGLTNWSLCATSQFFYIFSNNVGTAHIYCFAIPEPLAAVQIPLVPVSTSGAITASVVYASGIASTGPSEPDCAVFAYLSSNTIKARIATGSSFGSDVTITTTAKTAGPFTVSVGLALSNLNNNLLTASAILFAYYDTTSGHVLNITKTTLALGSVATITIPPPSGNNYYVVSTPTQLTISFVDGGTDTIFVGMEFLPQASIAVAGAPASTYAYLIFITVSFAGATVLSGTGSFSAWGGLALIGRARLIQWAVNPDPTFPGTAYTTSVLTVVVPTRSGWRHQDGSWGTISTAGAPPAYPTGFLYDSNGNLIAKFGDGDVGSDSLWPEFASGSYTFVDLPILSEAAVGFGSISTQGWFSYPFPQYFDFTTIIPGSVPQTRADVGAVIGAMPGPAIATWTDASFLSPPAPAVQQGSTATIAAALTAHFDGNSVFEAGWLMAAPTPVVLLTTGGSLPASYSPIYLLVLVFTDANGKLYRSAPSFQFQAATTTSGHNQYDIFIPAMFQTLRRLTIDLGAGIPFPFPITVEIYRNVPTVANNSNFYRLPLVTEYNITADFFSGGTPTSANFFQEAAFTDNTTDANLLTCLQLYTEGSQAGASIGTNNPLPFDCLAVWNNATWGIARRNGAFELWFTWPQDNNLIRSEGPTWNENNRLPLPSSLGIPRALVPMDTQLIVLGSLADYTIQGSGPNRATTYADDNTVYTTPAALPGSGGIQTLNGATIIPQGAIFQGQQGFTLLDRGLNYTLIGNEVRTFTNQYQYLPGVFFPAMQAILLYAATPPGTISGDTASIYPDLMYFYNSTNWAQIEHPIAPALAPSKNLLTSNQATGSDTTDAVADFILGNIAYGNTVTSGATMTSSTVQAWQGLRSVLLNALTSSDPNVAVKVAVTLLPATQYTFSVYVFGQPSTTEFILNAVDSSNTNLASSGALVHGNSWARYSITFTTGALPDVELSICTGIAHLFEFYVDGLQLELGASATSWVAPPGTTLPYLRGPVVGVAKVLNTSGTFSLYPATTDGGVNQQLVQYSRYISFQTPWIELTTYTNATTGGLAPIRNPADYGTVREVQLIMDTLNQASYQIETTLTVVAEFDYANNTTTPPQTQTLTVTTQPGDTQFRWGLNASQCRRVRLTVTIDGAASSTNGPQPMFLITGLEIGYATDAGLSRLGTPNSSNF